MTEEQPPYPTRPPTEDPPATPPPPAGPATAPGTPVPGQFPGWSKGATPPPGGYQPPHLPYPPPGYPGFVPPPPILPRNGTGLAALILGVVAASISWTVFLSPLAVFLGLLAVAFGLIGAGRAKRGAATNRPAALGGLWSGVGGAVIGVALTVVLVVRILTLIGVETAAGSDYLAEPGEEVVFEDGLAVRMNEPRRVHDNEIELTVNVTNGSDDSVEVFDDSIRALVNGTEVESHLVYQVARNIEDLPPGESRSVAFRIAVERGARDLGIDYAPGGDYEYAYWQLPLPGSGEPDGPPDDERPEDEDPPGASLDV
ncbi:hypothetical protein [Streptomyces profundus]|uniref:hypothetical protein n=1 Tax=Streptomyces profundus TaxID=2867410 RepID=UPI001D169F5F|nr:hypothetical protein [Streptomyces sp. MA3_2.13]UED86904.1 hypothetical protein K4G22_24120 [Streptomyces sp. MA3_2.13]